MSPQLAVGFATRTRATSPALLTLLKHLGPALQKARCAAELTRSGSSSCSLCVRVHTSMISTCEHVYDAALSNKKRTSFDAAKQMGEGTCWLFTGTCKPASHSVFCISVSRRRLLCVSRFFEIAGPHRRCCPRALRTSEGQEQSENAMRPSIHHTIRQQGQLQRMLRHGEVQGQFEREGEARRGEAPR